MSLGEELRRIDSDALIAASRGTMAKIGDGDDSFEEGLRMMAAQADNFPALADLSIFLRDRIREAFPEELHGAALTGINVALLAVSEFALSQIMRERFPDAPILPKDLQS